MTRHWEHGSEFDLREWPPAAGAPPPGPWEGRAVFCAAARDALRALLAHGREHCGWQRLRLPEYLSNEVKTAAARGGLPVETFQDGPGALARALSSAAPRPGDVLMRVNFFGLRDFSAERLELPGGVVLIEDHTHDPFSPAAFHSQADFCLASLRKWLPMPDGAALWSPKKLELPPPPPRQPEAESASARKLAAMLFKWRYLQGLFGGKAAFRELAAHGERGLGVGEAAAMSPWSRLLLKTFPWPQWRQTRRENHNHLTARLEDLKHIEILLPPEGSDAVPYCFSFLLPAAETRENARKTLIAQDIYPLALWNLEKAPCGGVSPPPADFSRHVLGLHCDMRYGEADMERVAAALRRAL